MAVDRSIIAAMVEFNYDSATWRRTRRQVLDRDEWRCRLGGPRCRVAAVEVHHRVAVADGGSVYELSNLLSVCRTCHLETRRDRVTWRPDARWAGPVEPSREW